MLQGIIVGVLRGGPHDEHQESLGSGQAAITSLPADRYAVRDIYIDRAGVWHERGLPTAPERVLPGLDVAIVCVTGAYGATGEIQRLLERYGVPYTGSRPMDAFAATHAVLAREHARQLGLRIPRYRHVDAEEQAHGEVAAATRDFLPPLVVRPACAQERTVASVLTGYQPVHQAVTGILAEAKGGAVVEEHVRGPRVRVVVLDHMRGQDAYALPAELYANPVAPNARCAMPDKRTRDEAERLAADLHRSLSLRHYSASLFASTPRGLVYLGTDPCPHLGAQSPLAASLRGVGISLAEFFSHIADLARGQGKR